MAEHDDALDQEVDEDYEEDYDEEHDAVMGVAEGEVDVQRLSPDRQLEGFSKRPLVPVFILAFIVHVVVIGLTSVPWLISYLNPSAEAPEEEQIAAEDTSIDQEDRSDDEPADEPRTLDIEPRDDQPSTGTDLRDDPRVQNPEYVEQLQQVETPPDDLMDDIGDRLPMPD